VTFPEPSSNCHQATRPEPGPSRDAKAKGVITKTQGMKINEKDKFTLLKEKIEKSFSLTPVNQINWENRRDSILKEINDMLK
jgi:hypothetical protein